MKKFCFIFGIFLIFWPLTSALAVIKNFQDAKKEARIIWSAHRLTVYCHCTFDKNLQINHTSCQYYPHHHPRAQRVEWEHIVPVSWFGNSLPCWRHPICDKKNGKKFKGRACCELKDIQFRKMYTDLHNLIPVIGEVNAARKNYRFTEFSPLTPEKHLSFHGCKIAISDAHRAVEPSDEIKGLIARAHLYMAHTYPFKLSKKQTTLFWHWNQSYPPSAWEREWNKKVTQVQGNDNLFITHYLGMLLLFSSQ